MTNMLFTVHEYVWVIRAIGTEIMLIIAVFTLCRVTLEIVRMWIGRGE